MKTINIRFTENETQLLRECIGKPLHSVLHDEFTFVNSSTEAVQFNIGDEALFLYSFTESMDHYGSTEDVAVWTLEKTAYPIIRQKKFITTPVELPILRILLVQETQQLFENGVQTYKVQLTRGLLFDFGQFQLAFEKAVWFSEEIYITRGQNLISKFNPVSDFCKPERWGAGIEAKCFREVVQIM